MSDPARDAHPLKAEVQMLGAGCRGHLQVWHPGAAYRSQTALTQAEQAR